MPHRVHRRSRRGTAGCTSGSRCLRVQRRTIEAADGDGGFAGRELDVDGGRGRRGTRRSSTRSTSPPLALLPARPARTRRPRSSPAARTSRSSSRRRRRLAAGRSGDAAVDGPRARRRRLGRRPRGARARSRSAVENVHRWWCRRAAATRSCAVRWSRCTPCSPSTTARSSRSLDPPAVAAERSSAAATRAPSRCSSATTATTRRAVVADHPLRPPRDRAREPGDLFDATEIDEILALRVLTLTDEEKAEARGTDARAAAIVDRCDDIAAGGVRRLHGAIRSLRPADAGRADPEPLPWWEPGVDARGRPVDRHLRIGGVEVAHGHAGAAAARRGAPTPTTCSSPA